MRNERYVSLAVIFFLAMLSAASLSFAIYVYRENAQISERNNNRYERAMTVVAVNADARTITASAHNRDPGSARTVLIHVPERTPIERQDVIVRGGTLVGFASAQNATFQDIRPGSKIYIVFDGGTLSGRFTAFNVRIGDPFPRL